MAIEFVCPSCHELLRLPETAAGRLARCGACQATIRVPGGPAEQPPAGPPEGEPAGPRRRSAGRPRPAGARRRRGPLFWVVIALAAAGAVAVLGCGGLVLALGAPRWREHESGPGGFRVELPAAPRRDLAKLVPNPNPNVRIEGTVLWLRREEFVVCYADFPPDRRRTVDEDALLKEAVADLVKFYPGSRVVQEDPVVVSDFPGREVVVEVPGKGVCVARVVLAESRFYVVIAGGPDAGPDNPRVRRFVGSFVINDPDQHAKAKERRDAPRLAAERFAAERKRQDDERRQREEAIRADDVRRRDEAEAKERAYQDSLRALRDAFRTPGRPAPDPALISGLVLHLGFDTPGAVWPREAGRVEVAAGATPGPGPRGQALYLPTLGRVTLQAPSPQVKAGLAGPTTVAGWVKLRYRPVTLFQVEHEYGRALGHLTVGGNRLVLNTHGGRDVRTDDTAASAGNRVSAAWTRDAEWHHVAAVRDRRAADERLIVYLDGRPVGESVSTPGGWSEAEALAFAVGIDIVPGTWDGPTGPPDRTGKPTWAERDELAYAVDEIVVYDRALAAAEVRMLAGVDPVPADLAKRGPAPDPDAVKPPAVTLTPADPLPALVGIAFDPGRKTAWVVTAAKPAELVRLSYPGLKEQARYTLPGPAGPVAFDPPDNVLFVVVRTDPWPDEPQPGGWPGVTGSLHRYDLDGLPAPTPGKPTAVTPAAAAKLSVSGPAVALAVTPDGEWVCGISRRQIPGVPSGGRFFRLPSHLRVDFGYLDGPDPGGGAGFPYRVGIPADGSAAWFPSGGTAVGTRRGEWCLLDPGTNQVTARPFFGHGLGGYDWLVHPSGDRLFAVAGEGVVEARASNPGQPDGRRLLMRAPQPADPARVWLGLTADGRYLFQTAAAPGGDLLTVVDTTLRPKPGFGVLPSADLNGEPGAFSAPFWVAPDGAVVAFQTGRVWRATYPAGQGPLLPPPVPRAWRPTVAPLPRLAPRRVADPTTIPGLKFYLALEGPDGAGVREGVSGKPVGRLQNAEFIAGVRGKGVRLKTIPKAPTETPVLDLADQKNTLRFDPDQPFTVCLWVRPVDGQCAALLGTRQVATDQRATLRVNTSQNPPQYADRKSFFAPWVGETADRNNPGTGQSVSGTRRFDKPDEWHHVAFVRDPAGQVRILLDGEELVGNRRGERVACEIEYDVLGLGAAAGSQATVDVDEFCAYGRALTDNEVRRLAGVPPLADPAADRPRAAAPPPPPPAGGFRPVRYDGPAVAAPGDFPGLKFHLPCDRLYNRDLHDAVSGRTGAFGVQARVVDGVRGKALRFTPRGRGDGPDFGMDLAEATDKIWVEAGKPFTLAVWARLVDPDHDNAILIWARPGHPARLPNRDVTLGLVKGTASLSLVDATDNARPTKVDLRAPIPERGQWFHLAMVRDDENRVRLLVNGAAPEGQKPAVFRHAFRYDRFRLVVGHPGTPAMDLADFCVYDRALGDDELRKLAGAGK